MGTYHPISFGLFDSITAGKDNKKKAYFGREERFHVKKEDKKKGVPYYDVGSNWGMKDKLSKKDILSKVGSSVTHHSVYY